MSTHPESANPSVTKPSESIVKETIDYYQSDEAHLKASSRETALEPTQILDQSDLDKIHRSNAQPLPPEILEKVRESMKLTPPPDPKSIRAKPIKATGHERIKVEDEVDDDIPLHVKMDQVQKMENDILHDKMLDDETIKTIKNLAQRNPITKELIDQAKIFTEQNKEEIKKQFNDLVAFYNVAHNKAFFYITAAEARMAIDYIKKRREGFTVDMENQEKRDAFVYEFIRNIPSLISNDIEKATDIENTELYEKVHRDIDTACGIEMLDIDTEDSKNMRYNPINAFVHTIEKLEGFNFDEKTKERLGNIKKEELPKYFVYNVKHTLDDYEIENSVHFNRRLTLNWINRVFAFIEIQNLTVDVILMNSQRIADVRNFGRTVYDEYTKKEFIKRRVFGQLFTAEIYPCNKLADDQIVFGSLNLMPAHGVFVNAIFAPNKK